MKAANIGVLLAAAALLVALLAALGPGMVMIP